MSAYPGSSGTFSTDCDTGNVQHWPAGRRLSLNFLNWALPRIQQLNDTAHVARNVGFSCAEFPDLFGLNSAQIDTGIFVDNSYFGNGISLQNDNFSSPISITQSVVSGAADFSGTTFAHDVNIDGSSFGDLDFTNATLRGLYADDVSVKGDLSLNGMIASAHVLLTDGRFKSVDLQGGTVASNLEMEDSTFTTIDAGGVRVGGNFDLDNAQVSGNVSLNGAKISGDVLFYGSKGSYHDVGMAGLVAGGQIRLDDANFYNIDAGGLDAEDGINASDSRVNSIDLHTSRIDVAADFTGLHVATKFSANAASVNALLLLGSSADRPSQLGSIDISHIQITEGLDLTGASFSDMDASEAAIKGSVDADGTHFRSLNMNDGTVQHFANFSGAIVSGKLDLNTATIGENLNINTYNTVAASIPTLDLTAATIGKTFDVSDSRLGGITANGIKIGLNMIAADSKIGDFSMENATVKSFATFPGSIFEDDFPGHIFKNELDLNSSTILGSLYLHSDDSVRTNIPTVDLTAASVGQFVDIGDSKFKTFTAQNAKIGLGFVANGTDVSGELSLNGSVIGGSVLARADGAKPANITTLDLTVAGIGQTLDVSGSNIATITAEGAQIGSVVLAVGTTVKDALDLNGASIGGGFNTDSNRNVRSSIAILGLAGSSIARGVDLSDATFDTVDAENSRTALSFLAARTAISGDLKLSGGIIGSRVLLEDASFGDVSAEYGHFGADIKLNSATFNSIDLSNSSIAGSVNAAYVSITQDFKIISADVKGSVHLGLNPSPDSSNTKFSAQNVAVDRAEIGGDFEAGGFSLDTNISAQEAAIDGDLDISALELDPSTKSLLRKIDFDGAKIGKNLTLELPSYNGSANFSRVSVGNELNIFSDPKWTSKAQLNLSSASARLFVTRLASWRTRDGKSLDANIDGFSYDAIQVPDDNSKNPTENSRNCSGSMAFAPIGCLTNWLHVNDRSYAMVTGGTGFDPGIYDQLAKTLNNMGRGDDAKEVLYEKGLREEETAIGPTKVFLFLDYFIGFGQKPLKLATLAIIMLLIGFFASYWSDDLCSEHEKRKFARGLSILPRRIMRRLFRKSNISAEYYAIRLSNAPFPLRWICSFLLCKIFKRLVYSLDNGLPLGVTLVERHKNYEHENSWFIQLIFILQKALGYIIVLLAVTAIAQTLAIR